MAPPLPQHQTLHVRMPPGSTLCDPLSWDLSPMSANVHQNKWTNSNATSLRFIDTPQRLHPLRLDSILSWRECSQLLLLSLRFLGCFVLGQAAADSTGELGAQVERLVLLALVKQTQLIPLRVCDHGADARNRSAHFPAANRSSSLEICSHRSEHTGLTFASAWLQPCQRLAGRAG